MVGEWTYQLRQGGLMRCCVQTLDDILFSLVETDQEQPAIGERICCAYHENYMIRAQDGVWEWDHE